MAQQLPELFFGAIIALFVLKWTFFDGAMDPEAEGIVARRSRRVLWVYIVLGTYAAVWGEAYVHGLTCLGGGNIIANMASYVLWAGLGALLIALLPLLLWLLTGSTEQIRSYWLSAKAKIKMVYRASPSLLVLAGALVLFSMFDETVRFQYRVVRVDSAYVYDRLLNRVQQVYICPPESNPG